MGRITQVYSVDFGMWAKGSQSTQGWRSLLIHIGGCLGLYMGWSYFNFTQWQGVTRDDPALAVLMSFADSSAWCFSAGSAIANEAQILADMTPPGPVTLSAVHHIRSHRHVA